MSTPKAPPFYQDPQFFRLQTYGLLAVVGLLLVALFVPMMSFLTDAGLRLTVHSSRIELLGPVPTELTAALQGENWIQQLLQVLTAFCVGASAASLFRYRNLTMLLTNTGVVMFALVALLAVRVYVVYRYGEIIRTVDAEPDLSMGLGYYLPLIAAVLLYGVRRQIRKDQATLKSAERFY